MEPLLTKSLIVKIGWSVAEYRRVLGQVPEQGDSGWMRVEGRGLVCLNGRAAQESLTGLAGKRVLVFGLESAEEARGFLRGSAGADGGDVVLVVRLAAGNLFRFHGALLDGVPVLYLLDFVPRTVEERLHAFSLFHHALSLGRLGFARDYLQRVLELLASPGSPGAEPPRLRDSLGVRSAVARAGGLFERVGNRLDVWHRRSRLRAALSARRARPPGRRLRDSRHVLITGWYGTETAGDKAILLELVHTLRENSPGARISITSIVPGLSHLTNQELGLDAEVLELRNLPYGELDTVDLVVFGGGPLMDSSQLKYIEVLFRWARRRRVPTMVFGCGVGPLRTEAGTRRVRAILEATDRAFFRDERSADRAQALGFSGTRLVACDPAFGYVDRWRGLNGSRSSPGAKLVLLLRAQTGEISDDATREADVVRRSCTEFVRHFLRETQGDTVEMLPMHTFWLGGDDRSYALRFTGSFEGEARFAVFGEAVTLHDLLVRISGARWGMPMRFHGHVFMIALQVPFVGIDYTGEGGKVRSLMERYRLEDCSVPVERGLTGAALVGRWEALEHDYEPIRSRMAAQLAADLERLEEVYRFLWSDEEGERPA